MIYKVYRTKRILNVHKHIDGGWFWTKYSASPYIGCEHGCEYCYSRDEKYNPHRASKDPAALGFDDAFSQYIKIKENAPDLLRSALRNKPREVTYLDSYQPIEAKYAYARKMLEVCLELGFPVFVNEKSPMLLRDLDVLKQISENIYLNVGWSIIAADDDEAGKIFESKAPAISARFRAMQELARNGILTGTIFMPILPFIYDTEENIEGVIKRTRECGGKYILEGGLTLWGYCKTHFYKALRKYDPELITKYDEFYRDERKSLNEHSMRIHQTVLKFCNRYGLTPYIPRPVGFYPEELQNNKKIAEKFYLEARELQLSGQSGHKEWAYRKAAWSLDELDRSVEKILQEQGIEGLMEIKGIGEGLARQIEKLLRTNIG